MMTTTQKTMKRTVMLFAATPLALVFFSGVALAVTKSCVAGVECFGTRKADTLNGSDRGDDIFGRGRGDTLNGFVGLDELYGQGGADRLFGGPNTDALTGGPGNDKLSGGEDSDQYYFGDGWGKDSIIDSSASSQNMVVFVEPPNATTGTVPATTNVTIKLFSGDGPEVKNASGTSTINWEGNVIGHVVSGAGNDHITGNFSDNFISSNGGADTIYASVGDDTIYVDDGSGDDVVDCGEGLIGSVDNDEVRYDPGDQIADDCETQTPVN